MVKQRIFKVGDTAWVPSYGNMQKLITCPDCLGNRYLTCILGDGTQITFDCECCREGWEYTGKLRIYEYQANVHSINITGLEIDTKGGIQVHRYKDGCAIYSDVFATKEEAMAFAEAKVIEHDKAEQNRIKNHKEYARKSWAWNATYHQRQIKDLEKKIAYHEAKLRAAQPKAKAEGTV